MDDRGVPTSLVDLADAVWAKANEALYAGRSEEYRELVQEYHRLVKQVWSDDTFPWRFIDGSPVSADYRAAVSVAVGEAALAQELFGDDELEAYAAGRR